MNFPGIWPAVVTPFRDDGSLHVAALEDLVDWLVEEGVDGIVGLGTMGEYRSLERQERGVITAAIVRVCGERVPVVIGVSADTAREATEFAVEAANEGVSGLMCLPPVTYQADEAELDAFFETVARSTDLPLMVYNNPHGTKNDLAPATIARLFGIENVVAVKECSGDARRIPAVIALTGGEMEVLVGGDDWALEGFCCGASGWVSGAAVVAPAECVELWRLVGGRNLDEAQVLYHRLLPLSRLDMDPKLVQYFKACLDRIGRYGGPCRAPRGPLSVPEAKLVDDAIAALGVSPSPRASSFGSAV